MGISNNIHFYDRLLHNHQLLNDMVVFLTDWLVHFSDLSAFQIELFVCFCESIIFARDLVFLGTGNIHDVIQSGMPHFIV